MKHYKLIGIAACIILIAACFLPWTYHGDLHENFTGFYSKNNEYGKPGKATIFFGLISLLLILTNKVWAKRTHVFIAGVLVAFTIRNYIVFTTCYFGYCPERKYGLYLLLLGAAGILIAAVFPDMKLMAGQRPTTDDGRPATDETV